MEPESGPMLAGNRYSLVCDVINVAPVHKLTVKWLRGNEIVKSVSYRDRSLDDIDVTLHNISDSLTIWASRKENGQIYTCQAELNLEPYDVMLRNSSMNITVECKHIQSFLIQFGCEMDANSLLRLFQYCFSCSP